MQLEHGFEDKKQGQVKVCLTDGADDVTLEIWDDGDRLPEDFTHAHPRALAYKLCARSSRPTSTARCR